MLTRAATVSAVVLSCYRRRMRGPRVEGWKTPRDVLCVWLQKRRGQRDAPWGCAQLALQEPSVWFPLLAWVLCADRLAFLLSIRVHTTPVVRVLVWVERPIKYKIHVCNPFFVRWQTPSIFLRSQFVHRRGSTTVRWQAALLTTPAFWDALRATLNLVATFNAASPPGETDSRCGWITKKKNKKNSCT